MQSIVKVGAACAATVIYLMATTPLMAATLFDFRWDSPAGSDTAASASGSLRIDRMAGEAFTEADVTEWALEVVREGAILHDFSSSDDILLISGTIAVDGFGASVSQLRFSLGTNSFRRFGCTDVDDTSFCPDGIVRIRDGFFTVSTTYNFGSQDAALASFRITREADPDPATVIPLPAALPLLLGGISALGLLGWRRRARTAG